MPTEHSPTPSKSPHPTRRTRPHRAKGQTRKKRLTIAGLALNFAKEVVRIDRQVAHDRDDLLHLMRTLEEALAAKQQQINTLRDRVERRELHAIEIGPRFGGIEDALNQHRQRIEDMEVRQAKWVEVERRQETQGQKLGGIAEAQTSLARTVHRLEGQLNRLEKGLAATDDITGVNLTDLKNRIDKLDDEVKRWVSHAIVLARQVDENTKAKPIDPTPKPLTAGEADPAGKDAHAPGAKLDAGKPDAALLLDFALALAQVARVATYGAKKYSRGGWQHVEDGQHRYTSAMIRHLISERRGPTDEESGLMHAAQVAWNALARLELLLRTMSKDTCP